MKSIDNPLRNLEENHKMLVTAKFQNMKPRLLCSHKKLKDWTQS